MRDEFDFLHENEHQSFLQPDIIVFGGQKYPKWQVCNIFAISQEGKEEWS